MAYNSDLTGPKLAQGRIHGVEHRVSGPTNDHHHFVSTASRPEARGKTHLDWAPANPVWTEIACPTPGNNVALSEVSSTSASVTSARLGRAAEISVSPSSTVHSGHAACDHAVWATHIFVASVLWWATMTSPSAGSKPTYPVGRRAGCQCRRNHAAECERPGRRVPGRGRRRDAQNWVTAPSPPDATGINVGFAAQLAPQFHASVVEG